MLFYKNDHRFSVVCAIRYNHDEIERLFETAKRSKHHFVFVNINEAIDAKNYQGVNIVNYTTDKDACGEHCTVKVLSEAYNYGYTYCDTEFLLFMDADVVPLGMKAIDFMANNLVEHQAFTIKELVVRKRFREGVALFNDYFRSLNLPSDNINYHFFALKDNTYHLAKLNEQVFTSTNQVEDALFKRNITIIHVDHGEELKLASQDAIYKSKTQEALRHISYDERLAGFRPLLLLLLAFHGFYFLMIWDWHVFNIIWYFLVHFALYLTLKPFVRHHPLTYVFTPLFLLYFDFILIIGLLRRWLSNPEKEKKQKHKAEKDEVNKEVETNETIQTARQEEA